MPSDLRRALPSAAPVVAGVAVFGAAAAAATRRDLHPIERQAFGVVNQLPAAAHPPIWAIMQAGSLGAVGVAAAIAAGTGRRSTAVALGVAGATVWGGAKVVKRFFGRGRPVEHIDSPTVRGRPASGLGFPSGHAAVATTLAVVAAPHLGPTSRLAVFAVAGLTGVARIYVGAHLPADVVGGTGLGLVAGGLTTAVTRALATPSR